MARRGLVFRKLSGQGNFPSSHSLLTDYLVAKRQGEINTTAWRLPLATNLGNFGDLFQDLTPEEVFARRIIGDVVDFFKHFVGDSLILLVETFRHL